MMMMITNDQCLSQASENQGGSPWSRIVCRRAYPPSDCPHRVSRASFESGEASPEAMDHTKVVVTIPAITPTFSLTSHPTTSPEVPRDTSSSHVPLGSHVIHPHAPSSRPMPHDPVSRPRWVRLRESPLSTPDAPDEPESSTDPWIDSAVLTKDLSILQGLLSELPMSLWSAVPDTDGH